MSKITLSNVGSITQNPTSAQSTINSNFATIQTAMDNTLSRDGTLPNTMQDTLDMNSNAIINLPSPVSTSSPLRLSDLNSFIGGGTINAVPAGGTTGQVLDKTTNADYAVGWTSTPSLTAIKNVGTMSVPTATDTFVGQNTTDTLTNKTLTTPTIGVIKNSSTVQFLSTVSGTQAIGASNAIFGDSFADTPAHGQISLFSQSNPTRIQGGTPAALATITLPNQTDTVVGRTTTDTLTNKSISGASNTLTGLTVSTLGGVTGSANSTTFLRGDNTWNTPSAGTIVFLETLTASTSSTLSTSVSWAGFSSIVFSINNILPSAGSNNFQFQVNAGGVQASSYLSSSFGTSTSTTIATNAATTYIPLTSLAMTTNVLSGEVKLLNPSGAGAKALIGTTCYGSTFCTTHVGGVWTGATAVTAAQFSLTTGTMTSGTIRVYGIV